MRTYIVYYYDALGRRYDLCEQVAASATEAKNKARKLLLDADKTKLHARAAE